MIDPLPKRVKIGSFWQDIVYENLPMLCYRCGRIGHRESQCTEGMLQPTTDPHASASQCPASPPLETTHVSTPWKTVQTHRTRARGRPLEITQRSRNSTLDSFPLNQTRGQETASHTHWERTHQSDAVLGQYNLPMKRTPGFHFGEVATQSKTALLLQPREEERNSMQDSGKAGCPTIAHLPSDVAVEAMRTPCMVMQHEHDFRPNPQPNRLSSSTHQNNGPLVGPSIHHTHHDGSGLETHTGVTKQPTPHSYHEQPLTYPPNLRAGDGNAGTTLEWIVSRAHSRQNGKLCSHSSSSTDCNAMEPNDANAESPIEARPTSLLPPLSQPPIPFLSPQG